MRNRNPIENSIIYEIYPISFYDSDGDGKGDIKGITLKIPYLKELGIDIVWLNPIFQTSFLDGGYDVENYSAIDSSFGSLPDLREMLDTAHKAGIKVLMDFVPGHTSIRHRWFRMSQKKERNRYSDYYIWTDDWSHTVPKALNGISERNGCVLTNYYSFQLALNYGYENVEEPWQMHYKDERLKPLREEICSLMRFWLDFGFDGFRIDMAGTLIKNRTSDESISWLWREILGIVKAGHPGALFMAEWGEPSVSVGKCGFDFDYIYHENSPYNQLLRLETGSNVLPELEGGNSYFNVEGQGFFTGFFDLTERNRMEIKGKGYQVLPSGYHDVPRLSFGRSMDGLKCFYAFLFTYNMVPLLYYGDEIGIPYLPGINKDGGYARTGARTPMQWDDSCNRGFTDSEEPYLPTDHTKGIDVKTQEDDQRSLLNTIKSLIRIHKLKSFGACAEMNLLENRYPLVFERGDEEKYMVCINPSGKEFFREIFYESIIDSNNVEVKENGIVLKAESFAVLALPSAAYTKKN